MNETSHYSPYLYSRLIAATNPSELDSHADTSVAGCNFRLMGEPTRHVAVHGYSPDLPPVPNVPIGTAGTVWVDSESGKRYLLVLNECLFFGDRLPNSLLTPNQLRMNGLVVDDTPRQFSSTSTHSILDNVSGVRIPLSLRRIISYFESSLPTLDEMDSLPVIELTSDIEWMSEQLTLQDREARIESETNLTLSTLSSSDRLSDNRLIAASIPRCEPIEFKRDDELHHALICAVNVVANDVQGDGLVKSSDTDVYLEGDRRVVLSALSTKERLSVLTPEILSKRWGIGLDVAKNTLNVTTYEGIRNVFLPSERKVRKKAPWINFPSIKGQFFTDGFFSQVATNSLHIGGSIYTNGMGYDRVYTWKSKGDHAETVMDFIHEVGVPQILVSDGALEETKGRARETCRKYRIKQEVTVPYSPWQNAAEASIRELKKSVRRTFRRTKAPKRLWSYCAKWCAAIRRLTPNSVRALGGRTPEEFVTGSTPDISPYVMFDWYQPVYYLSPAKGFPGETKQVGRWLGVAENCTDEMAFLILGAKGLVVIRKSVWSMTADELRTPTIIEDIRAFDETFPHLYDLEDTTTDELPEHDLFRTDDDEVEQAALPEDEPVELHDYTPEELDEYINAELMVSQGGERMKARVIKRQRDMADNLIGKRHSNPILDTREYLVEFADGSSDTLATNVIAENMYAQVDPEGKRHGIFIGIVDHRADDEAIHPDGKTYKDKHGRDQPRMTTKGWELCVQWADESTSWLPLCDMKRSNPIEVAEYAVANKLAELPAFSWWVRTTLRKRDRFIKKVKTRYFKRTHKFGIALPKTVREALELDRRNGNHMWRDAIAKEMGIVMPAFEFQDDDVIPIGYQLIQCHMIFDIKQDLTRKARLVAGGHMTEIPDHSTSSSVVGRDSVRIAFVMAMVNAVGLLSCDVQNAYLNAPTKEKCYTIAGPEFGPDNEGRPVLIVRALYGLRTSGARWRDHLAGTLRDLGFKSCLADPDVYMRPATRPDGHHYYEYILVYVDDLLVVSHQAQLIMDQLGERYTLKAGSVKVPTEYLGADIKKYSIPPVGTEASTECWALSSDTYVKRAIADVTRTLAEVGQQLKPKIVTPVAAGYRPELDSTPELDDEKANYYQGLIGVLRWMVELGRIDIMVSVTLLSSYLTNPREGHLEQVYHIFAYLKAHDRSCLVFDPRYPTHDETRFKPADWADLYPGAEEAIPLNAPKPRGNPVDVMCYVDADHAGCRVTRRSHTGILLYVQNSPITWYSKRQNTVEASTFGSEFVAMKTAIEQIEALRYKLRMMGIPITGPASVFCDNQSVFQNATVPESVIKKKHNSIAYHRTREAQAAGTVRIAWENGETNLADVLTKLLLGPRLRQLIKMILN